MGDWNEELVIAGQRGDIEALKLSLQNGADIDYQDVDGGLTALMWAVYEGHLEICRLLIDTGCKIDITARDGVTALMIAADRGRLEICRLLIDRGCKIDITEELGWTALMSAAGRGRLEICRLLIDTGCKIDTTTNRGYTALHLAAEEGYLQTTRCLVEQGSASPLVTTDEGQTPYDLAAESMEEEVMEYLQTVMSEKSSGMTAGQGREDSTRDKYDSNKEIKLDFSDILDQLMTNLVISVNDRRSIEASRNQENELLQIVTKKGEPNKSVCIDVLQQSSGYKDLGKELKKMSAPTENTESQDVPDYKIRLQKNYLHIINTIKHNNQ